MPKLAAGDVTVAEIQRYLENYSDFAFELNVLRKLLNLGLLCRHAGTYEDPVTQKTREYDIQAETENTDKTHRATLRLAIECKNLRPNFPLVIHRVPRASHEAFIDVVCSKRGFAPYGMQSLFGERVRLWEDTSPYPAGQPVGKSSDQVGKRPDGEVVSSDQDVFDRITQAVHSAYDLVRMSHYASLHEHQEVFAVIIPFLVVPADRLWVVDYNTDGSIHSGPNLAKHASYFIDRDWLFGGNAREAGARYSISHLEICEADYLSARLADLFNGPYLNVNTISPADLQKPTPGAVTSQRWWKRFLP